MSITVKYVTNRQMELTTAQLSLVEEYRKNIYEDSVLKRVEIFKNGSLSLTQYLVGSSEIDDVLLSDPNAQIITHETFNGYDQETSLVYRDGGLIGKRIIVLDENDNCIYMAPIDLISDDPDYSSVVKTLYDEEGEDLYEFDYNEIGTCVHIYNLQETQADIFPSRIGVDPDIEFSWTGNEYYQFAYPVIPA
ncbi:MAG: hypothetical protein A3D31_03635 [Candidatus Fluviicola riflensis]|nr:MAG: hypothetical protein CHH17_11395 [Candidatus Fluviicola riflensis]OGS79069.1 MAG: hypothetical protein A3D31_03635 [Candidatus Fluviicola riflensis]OGS86092.1 MAG: hypothetical protein A3E30_11125 [Fluviicola sp. RIFCSPHIGHO2_12_FULL_43_24]OGS86501.1 MAG: hypothetical protein A2724_03095 [Fluviicola sp. RIFCSPHIGHO2_01_FULL_43_53]